MPPPNFITLKPGILPCNASDAIVMMTNETSQPEGDVYDHVGAMEFIIATLLVYSLMGIAGLLLMRIKKSTSKSHRRTGREEHLQQYIKQAEELRISGYKLSQMIEAQRMSHRIMKVEKQKREKRLEYKKQCLTTDPATATLLGKRDVTGQLPSQVFLTTPSPTEDPPVYLPSSPSTSHHPMTLQGDSEATCGIPSDVDTNDPSNPSSLTNSYELLVASSKDISTSSCKNELPDVSKENQN